MEVVHEGWLTKSPPPKRLLKVRWHTRWFVLRSGELPGQYLLEYYVDETRKKLKGRIDLDQCEQVDAGVIFPSEKDSSDSNFMFDIRTPSRIYYLRCPTEHEMNHWVDCLCQVCGLKAQTDDAPASNPVIYPHPTHISTGLQHHQMPQSSNVPSENDLAFLNSTVNRAESNMYISGPYIPISECITGRKAASNNRNQPDPAASNVSPGGDRRMSIPSEVAPPAPGYSHDSALTTPASSTSTLASDALHTSVNGWRKYGWQPGDASTLPHPVGNTKHRTGHASIEHSRSLRGPDHGGRRTTRSCGSTSEDPSVRSPPGTGSSSSVCTDDDRSTATPLNNQVFFSGSENPGSTAFEGNMAAHAIRTLVIDPAKQGDAEAPPRPPKPPHLEVPQQNYMNIDSVVRHPNSRKNSIAESGHNKMPTSTSVTSHDGNFISSDAEPSPVSATSSVASSITTPGIGSNDHDPSRSQQGPEMVSGSSVVFKRPLHSGSAAPSSVTSDRVFSYDIRQASALAPGESDPRISPALYTNLSSINSGNPSKGPVLPPTINRGLKPKVSMSDGSSLSGYDTSPSMDTPSSIAPAIDRNLKPSSKGSTNSSPAPDCAHGANTIEFVLDPAPRSRPKGDQGRQGGVLRAAPSPTLPSSHHHPTEEDEIPPPSAHSWRNSGMPDEQVFYPAHVVRSPPTEIQYLDLDLNSGADLGSAAGSTTDLSPNHKSFMQPFNTSKLQLGGKKTSDMSASMEPARASGSVGPKAMESSKVEYQTVDFVKTEALSNVKKKMKNFKDNQP